MDLIEAIRRRTIAADGRSTVQASRWDRRCSYCAYYPPSGWSRLRYRNIMVYIHGQGRRFQFLLDALIPLAQANDLVVVCPLFPADLFGDGNSEGYKQLEERDLRYDEVVLDLVREMREAFQFGEPRFLLGGFSGGGQFAHRFLYLHPSELSAVSIAAPGGVTLLESGKIAWRRGGGPEMDDGFAPDLEQLGSVRIQLVVGSADVGGAHASSESALGGRTRVERAKNLHDSFARHGLAAEFTVVTGAGHNFIALLPHIEAFFAGERGAVPSAGEPPREPEPCSDSLDGRVSLGHRTSKL